MVTRKKGRAAEETRLEGVGQIYTVTRRLVIIT
jgi:hypothetical protein